MANSCKWYDPSCALDWLKQEFKSFFLWVYDSILSGFAVLIELIPVPSFIQEIQSTVLNPTVSWFLEPFNVTFGLGVIAGAYTARFILRRIPGIG